MRKTVVNPLANTWNISYSDRCIFIGSCFSEHISQKMDSAGFKVESNPLGVLFNPLSIANLLSNHEAIVGDEAFIQKENIFLNWHANSKVYGAESLLEFKASISNKLKDFKESLLQADVLFVTFGSSFVYRYSKDNIRVANCHKIPQKEFEKELLEVGEMVDTWKKVLAVLKQLNPKLKIICTVSPVRHIKDGLIENNRSKARLFELIGELEKEGVCYFPAYELVMDECRDYAYFEGDGVHPNSYAVNRVWEYFGASYFTSATYKVMEQYLSFKRFFQHKAIHPESETNQRAIKVQEAKFSAFLKQHPHLDK